MSMVFNMVAKAAAGGGGKTIYSGTFTMGESATTVEVGVAIADSAVLVIDRGAWSYSGTSDLAVLVRRSDGVYSSDHCWYMYSGMDYGMEGYPPYSAGQSAYSGLAFTSTGFAAETLLFLANVTYTWYLIQ